MHGFRTSDPIGQRGICEVEETRVLAEFRPQRVPGSRALPRREQSMRVEEPAAERIL